MPRVAPGTQHSPLRVLFVITSMPVGGAEVLLVNLVRRLDRQRFLPEICCLKEPGPLGEQIAAEVPVHSGLLRDKRDVRVVGRLVQLLRRREIDMVVTVGAGDKMFWGRLAAWYVGIPVASALHSTGWPDTIGRLNRWLTPITDAFIAVAQHHGQYLTEMEGFPAGKVRVIPNGVDAERFRPDPVRRRQMRRELQLDEDAPVCGIVAALRPEKNHALFLNVARRVVDQVPKARFVIVGDGPERPNVERLRSKLGLDEHVRLLGARSDIPELLNALDLFSLTSRMEANPVSILEAMAVGMPVVAPRVGSIPETVEHHRTGLLAQAGSEAELAAHWETLLSCPELRRRMGQAARQAVEQRWTLEHMVRGYEQLMDELGRAGKGSDSLVAGAIR